MITLIQKPEVDNETSFACREYRTPQFESAWHKHEEYELILITRGQGTLMMGDYLGQYKTGDVYFIASNLPHWFRKQNANMIGSAIVVHFKKDIFGETFLSLPELKNINKVLKKNEGIQLKKALKENIATHLKRLSNIPGYYRIQQLLLFLQLIGSSSSYTVHTKSFETNDESVDQTISLIFDFSFKHYHDKITLEQVAELSNMSIPTFCRFFKKGVKKTYFEFLQELRINHASKLLTDTNKPVLEICYESGFNSWGHFSKKFREIKKTSPSMYRNEFTT
jgi:AraC-like DNA-binding protein